MDEKADLLSLVRAATISHHLKKLREAGLPTSRRSAHNVLYRVAARRATEIMQLFTACTVLSPDIDPGMVAQPGETERHGPRLH